MRSSERGDVARLFEALELLAVTDAIARRAGRHLRAERAPILEWTSPTT